MNLVKVKKPEVIKFDSQTCPDHWQNIIIFGNCWKHQKQHGK